MGFSDKNTGVGSHFLLPGDLPNPGIEPGSPALQAHSLPSEPPEKPLGGFLVVQLVKNLPAMLEIWVQSLGWEDTLEKGMSIHSSILAQRIPWTI